MKYYHQIVVQDHHIGIILEHLVYYLIFILLYCFLARVFSFHNKKGYTHPLPGTQKERLIKKFDDMNLLPSFLPAWYLAIKEKRQNDAIDLAQKALLPKKTKNIEPCVSHEILTILLKSGPLTCKELLPLVQVNYPKLSRTKLLVILSMLKKRESVQCKIVKDTTNIFKYHVNRLSKIPEHLRALKVVPEKKPKAEKNEAKL